MSGAIKMEAEVRPVELHELGTMLRTVVKDDPELKTNKDLANAVSETFDVLCTEEDIEGYHNLYDMHEYFASEDYELEERRLEYGHFY